MRILPPLVAALALGGAPAAAAPWSPPSSIPTSVGNSPVLAIGAAGPRAVVLPGRAGADPPRGTQPGGLAAVTRPAAGQPFGVPEQIVPAAAYIDGAAVAIDAPSGAAFATWRDVGAPIASSV